MLTYKKQRNNTHDYSQIERKTRQVNLNNAILRSKWYFVQIISQNTPGNLCTCNSRKSRSIKKFEIHISLRKTKGGKEVGSVNFETL